MIIFQKTKKVGLQSFLVFMNEAGSVIDVPVDEKIGNMFLHYFDRLSPGVRPVEIPSKDGVEDS